MDIIVLIDNFFTFTYIYCVDVACKDEMFISTVIYNIICGRGLPLAIQPSSDGVQQANGLVQRKDQHVEKDTEDI